MSAKSGAVFGGIFDVKCYGPDGRVKWHEKATNQVVGEGLDYILGILLQGNTPSDPWYVGLMSSTPTVVEGDQLTGTHSGWTEVTSYSEGSRQEFVDGSISTHSIDNSGSKASFSINSDSTTIGGAFLADSSTTGTNGLLLCAAAFDGGDKSADSGDTLEVQYSFSAADDGA